MPHQFFLDIVVEEADAIPEAMLVLATAKAVEEIMYQLYEAHASVSILALNEPSENGHE